MKVQPVCAEVCLQTNANYEAKMWNLHSSELVLQDSSSFFFFLLQSMVVEAVGFLSQLKMTQMVNAHFRKIRKY